MNYRHRCYMSYDHRDESRVRSFMDEFDPGGQFLFTRKETVPEYILNSTNQVTIAQKVRQYFLDDSTVTIVMVGERTWEQRVVDAELQASLYREPGKHPNGLLAVRLLHKSVSLRLPERLRLNLDSGFARFVLYPDNEMELSGWIDEAYRNRSERLESLKNPLAVSKIT